MSHGKSVLKAVLADEIVEMDLQVEMNMGGKYERSSCSPNETNCSECCYVQLI